MWLILMLKYLKYIKSKDPAYKTYIDIILFCTSFWVMLFYRLAHFLYKIRFTLIALFIMNVVKIFTGIEIHPNAKIGRNLYIDHGIGTVIGETAVIGDNCLFYHNVTLGSIKNTKEKRHPTIKNNVMIGTGSIILGNIVIGENVKIGAGSIVLKNVEPNQTIVGLYK